MKLFMKLNVLGYSAPLRHSELSEVIIEVQCKCSITLAYEMPEMYYVTSANDKGCSRAEPIHAGTNFNTKYSSRTRSAERKQRLLDQM